MVFLEASSVESSGTETEFTGIHEDFIVFILATLQTSSLQ